MRVYVTVGLLFCATALMAEAVSRLIACPDCTAQVSKRAVFCPHCGCPKEAIEEAVKALEPKVIPPAETLLGETNRGKLTLYPCIYDNEPVLMADLADVEDIETLLLSNPLHNCSVDYSKPRLSTVAPVILFSTPASEQIAFKEKTTLTLSTVWHDTQAPAREVAVDLTQADPLKVKPISPKALKQQGRAWRKGIRDPETYTHPFYQSHCNK